MAATKPTPGRETHIARLAVVLLLVALGLWISANFLPALVWAVVICVAIDPLHMRLRRKWPGPKARVALAGLITSLIAAAILIPLAIGIAQAAREVRAVAGWITQAQTSGLPVPDWVEHLPVARDLVTHWWEENLLTPANATLQIQHLRHSAFAADTRFIGSNLLRRLVTFAFTLIALFFLLRDRDSIIEQLRGVGDRLFGASGERVGYQAILSIRGTIDGLVLVGIGEGAVMAIAYVVLGVPNPLLLGGLTAVAAMIPFGAALVLAIAAALLLAQGSVGGAIAVIVIGMIVVGIADHFIRPILIGGATRLPFLWVLIGILGGVETFGLLGLFIGPATMAVLIMLWREFIDGPPVGHTDKGQIAPGG
jgi:predicted PurR-regulated permease PerM